MSNPLNPRKPLLLVDDEPFILNAMAVTLELAGLTNYRLCSSSDDAERLIGETDFEAVTLDLIMPGKSGRDLLPLIRERQPETPVIIVTGTDEVETAVEMMRSGAYDFLTKPIDKTRLVTSLKNAVESREIRDMNDSLRQRMLDDNRESSEAFRDILTDNPRMHGIFGYVEALAETSLAVLITGESGVGKELLAQAVHRASGRGGPFVPVNIAGLDDHLFSDTMFGHRKGAFTGAASDRRGMVEKASGGTLFLDEIGDLSSESQIKLLRLLQEREYYPLGSDTASRTDARFVFATNHDLEDLVQKKEFRQDLYYRLKSHRVKIPALRERPEDIPLLMDHFLDLAARDVGKPRPKAARRLYAQLSSYSFPGNVRELQGMVIDALVRHGSGPLTMKSFDMGFYDGELPKSVSIVPFDRPGDHSGQPPSPNQDSRDSRELNYFHRRETLPTLKKVTDDLIEETLTRHKGNQTRAAESLGMTRSALNKRLTRGERKDT